MINKVAIGPSEAVEFVPNGAAVKMVVHIGMMRVARNISRVQAQQLQAALAQALKQSVPVL